MSDPVSLAASAGHAWSTTPRQEPPKRDAAERSADFREVYGCYDEATARVQASRCVQCPKPLCVAGCPLQLHIPEWLSLLADGEFLEAATELHASGTIPEICARLCPADRLCEDMCIITGRRAEPVSIWALEHFLNEYAFAHGVASAPPAMPNGRRVAVIGATAGGIACATELAKLGYAVTLLDEGPIGDTLLPDAPAFRLGRAIVQRRIALLEQQGVQFRAGAVLDRELARGAVETEFDCVYLAVKARQPRRLEIPGVTFKGVGQAAAFIRDPNSTPGALCPAFDVAGKRVLVIGGGETAIDCLRTALRRGARQAIGVYRRNEESMPCSRREYENAVEEGAVYAFGATPIAVLGNERGEVSGIQLVRTTAGAADSTRSMAVVTQPGTEFEVETDRVFLALGFEPQIPFGAEMLREIADRRGTVPVDEHQMTSRRGMFAGGDLVRGPCMPVEAVRDARKAAGEIDRYLQSRLPGNPPPHDA